MSKMHSVLSKHKNPDRYIRRLKAEVEMVHRRERESFGLYETERGRRVCTWTTNTTRSINTRHSHSLNVFNPGDTVVMIGTVTKVEAETRPDGQKTSAITFDLRETRSKDTQP